MRAGWAADKVAERRFARCCRSRLPSAGHGDGGQLPVRPVWAAAQFERSLAGANVDRFSSKEITADGSLYDYGHRLYDPNLIVLLELSFR